MAKFVVRVVYTGVKTFVVDADKDDDAGAKRLGQKAFENGEPPYAGSDTIESIEARPLNG